MRERRHVSDQKIGLLSTANRIESDSREFNHAALPDRERQSLSRQMGVELDQIPHKYDEYFDFLKNKLGVERSLNGRRVRSDCR
jgi:DNA-binding transcriptional MerR regulator